MSQNNKERELLDQQDMTLLEEELHKHFVNNLAPVPEELEDRISATILSSNGPATNKRRYAKYLAAIAMLLGIFVASVKLIPAFAVYASNIPVIKLAVNWLQGDSGTENAKNHGYKEIEGITLEENGITVELSSIMFDEDRLAVTASAYGDRIQAILDEVEAVNSEIKEAQLNAPVAEGKEPLGLLSVNVTFKSFENPGGIGSTTYDSDRHKSFVDVRAEKIFEKGEAMAFLSKEPKYLTLEVEVIWHKYRDVNEVIHVFKDIKLPFDKADFMMSKGYDINMSIPLQHGQLLLEELTISPTRMRLDISYDMEEGYSFVGIEKPYLMDSKGNKYMQEGLVSTSRQSDPYSKVSYYFVPSKYFDEVDEMYFGFEEYYIGEASEYDFTVSLEENYPKSFTYMGEEIIIEKVSYGPTTEGRNSLWIDLLLPPALKNFGSLKIEAEELGSSFGYTDMGNAAPTPVYFGIEVEPRQEYRCKLQFAGYRYPFNKTIPLN